MSDSKDLSARLGRLEEDDYVMKVMAGYLKRGYDRGGHEEVARYWSFLKGERKLIDRAFAKLSKLLDC